MPFVRVHPDDAAAVETVAGIVEAARKVDDPDEFPVIIEPFTAIMRYGWDMEPADYYLYAPTPDTEPVGLLQVDMPRRDNRHLVWVGITTHPDFRRHGHGSAMMAEAVRLAGEAGRTTLWVGTPEDDEGARAFVERHGFRYASRDARRRQVLRDVDQATIDQLSAKAQEAAGDYQLERRPAPSDDDLLRQLVEVTAAINDAPMGDLTYEDEVFDVQRIRDYETAHALSGYTTYRVVARHRETGDIGGHTVILLNPCRPAVGHQADTSVARSHRGHRLGLLLKIEAMRWLAEVEPQLELIETWNNVDNRFMIDVNETLGYRLNRVFCTSERTL